MTHFNDSNSSANCDQFVDTFTVFDSPREDSFKFAWWLKNLLPASSPLQNDAEFYAVVTFLINLSTYFNKRKQERHGDLCLDYLLHAATLLDKYLRAHPEPKLFRDSGQTQPIITHAFAHYLLICIDLHDDDSPTNLLTDHPWIQATKRQIAYSDDAKWFYFAAIGFHANYLTPDFDLLRTAWRQETPPSPYLEQAYLKWKKTQKNRHSDRTTVAQQAGVTTTISQEPWLFEACLQDQQLYPSKKITPRAEELELMASINRCTRYYAPGGLFVLTLGAIASIAVGTVLSITWPVLLGVVSLAVLTSLGISLLSHELNAKNPATLFGKPSSTHVAFEQPPLTPIF